MTEDLRQERYFDQTEHRFDMDYEEHLRQKEDLCAGCGEFFFWWELNEQDFCEKCAEERAEW